MQAMVQENRVMRMKKNLYIVIVGSGRVGSYLANQLSRAGHSVVAIDRSESSFNQLSSDFSGFRVGGDATQMAILKEAKLGNADVLIATTQDDNVNLMVAQIAREIFHVSKVLARVYDPKREDLYAHLGIETICPTSVASEMFLRAIVQNADNSQKRILQR